MKQRNNMAARLGGDRPGYGRVSPATDGERTIAAAQHHDDGYSKLTGRERWIVSELIRHKGAPNKVIAYALQISPNTLRNHLASIYGKLGVRRRVELVVYALERGLHLHADGEAGRSTSGGR